MDVQLYWSRTPRAAARLRFKVVVVTCVLLVLPVLSKQSPCSELPIEELSCDVTCDCVYGLEATAKCVPAEDVECEGTQEVNKTYTCQMCWQVDDTYQVCSAPSGEECELSPSRLYRAECTTEPGILCLGSNTFEKYVPCTVENGYNWLTALILSILLGGLGIDRCYLGYAGWGVTKCLTFGGMGIWALLDSLLIAIGYLGPSDGSRYI